MLNTLQGRNVMRQIYHKNIERHTAHTIVPWPNPKQWIIVHTSDLMMIIRQSFTRILWKKSSTIGYHICLGALLHFWTPVVALSTYSSAITPQQQHDIIPVYVRFSQLKSYVVYQGSLQTNEEFIIEFLYGRILGAVSIRKTVLPGMAIPMLKIRRPNGRLIFNMEIAIRR